MNSQEKNPKIPQERSGFTPKNNNDKSTSRDIAEKPFPCKPVCHKRLVKFTSHDLDLEKKCATKKLQDVPNNPSLNKDSSRLTAGELQMTKAIQEKQLMLQKKLWKVEDVLRAKIQHDNVGFNVYKGNQTVEKKHYGRKQEIVYPDTKTKQRTDMRGSEMLTERQNPKQYKFRQDTITQKTEQIAKWDKMPAGETLTKKKEVSRAKYDNSKQTQSQQKVSCRLATGDRDNAEGGTLHEEVVLPKVSSSPSWKLELESTDKNVQLYPCSICKRNFLPDRLEKHKQICEKLKKAKRPVYNSYLHRNKGLVAEEFWKTNTWSRTPEKKKQSQHKKT